MSEQDKSVEEIAMRMMDNTAEMRKALVNHAEQIRNLNQTLAAINTLLQTHGHGLQMHQRALEEIAGRMCIAFDSPEAPGGINWRLLI